MSPRTRVVVVVAVAAVAASATAVGLTLVTRTDVDARPSTQPPFVPDPTASAQIQNEVRDALAAWPAGTVRRLRVLAEQYPRSALVRYELGLALALSGLNDDAVSAWRAAERVQPDSPSAVRAQDLRFRDTPPGLPPFVPSFTDASNAAQRHLLRGAAFQQALRPVSARRQFDTAAGLTPNDPEALTAAAVGRYDKDRPELAFSRLGPLARRFPHAQTVRFHLGLLLIYFRDLPKAREELRLARAEGPRTRLGKRAEQLLRAAGSS